MCGKIFLNIAKDSDMVDPVVIKGTTLNPLNSYLCEMNLRITIFNEVSNSFIYLIGNLYTFGCRTVTHLYSHQY